MKLLLHVGDIADDPEMTLYIEFSSGNFREAKPGGNCPFPAWSWQRKCPVTLGISILLTQITALWIPLHFGYQHHCFAVLKYSCITAYGGLRWLVGCKSEVC